MKVGLSLEKIYNDQSVPACSSGGDGECFPGGTEVENVGVCIGQVGKTSRAPVAE
jgi:hypothetical protein